ncbi:MAG: LLM class flavin-dependent oxidoreductase [Candidatus Thorarchaeota archaeon]
MRGARSEEKFTFQGKHYVVQDLISFPKPVQKPHPTIWVGSV